jgi:hypothetical protein
VDDTLLSFGATEEQDISVRNALGIYASGIGQLMNPSMWSILFSDMLRHREDMIWLQSTRTDWLREGDRDTKKSLWRALKNKLLSCMMITVYSRLPLQGCSACRCLISSPCILRIDPLLNCDTITNLTPMKIIEEMNM